MVDTDDILVRTEEPRDAAAVAEITRLAFEGHPDSGRTEDRIVEALRRAGALSVSLVAECDGRVVGHIAFSTISISSGSPGWHGLGPLSVAPGFQGRRVGSRLVTAGLSCLRGMGAAGCVVVGPAEFYRRFGFDDEHELLLQGVAQMPVHALVLEGPPAWGRVEFHPVFAAGDASPH